MFASAGLNGPHDMTFGPDGQFYVSNAFGTESVVKIDGRTGKLISTFIKDPALGFPLGLTWDARGNLLVVNQGGNEVRRYDGITGKFLNLAATAVNGGLNGGLFAAIMSTADAFLNIGAAALTHDIPKALNKTCVNELRAARIGTIVIALAAAAFALYSHYENARLIALLGIFGWGTFAAALVPTVAIGLNWKRGTAKAACTAIIASLILNFTIEVF